MWWMLKFGISCPFNLMSSCRLHRSPIWVSLLILLLFFVSIKYRLLMFFCRLKLQMCYEEMQYLYIFLSVCLFFLLWSGRRQFQFGFDKYETLLLFVALNISLLLCILYCFQSVSSKTEMFETF